jgi:hypothetical protein
MLKRHGYPVLDDLKGSYRRMNAALKGCGISSGRRTASLRSCVERFVNTIQYQPAVSLSDAASTGHRSTYVEMKR